MSHAYPTDLAAFVHARLAEQGVSADASTLETLLSIAYQASLLREEGRPLAFRLLHSPAEALSVGDGPPEGVLRARFETPRPLDEQEIRRVAPATRLERTMIGISGASPDALRIWGLVHTGAAWLRELQGGRTRRPALPSALSIEVSAPGTIVVRWAGAMIARLTSGSIVGRMPDVFGSTWLPAACTEPRGELFGPDGEPPTSERRDLVRHLDRQFVARLIANVRLARHGGTIALLPRALAEETTRARAPIAIKYPFSDEAPRRRYLALLRRLLDGLANEPSGVTWASYLASTRAEIVAIDDALLELARGVADLAAVDGVVLLSKTFEVMGFGGEILGELPHVPTVKRAIDLEGIETVTVSTEAVGTRHRSAYRLVAAIPEALVFVVSQDGDVRLVASKDGAVTYWDQLGAAPLEI